MFSRFIPVRLSNRIVKKFKPYYTMGCIEQELQAPPIRSQEWFYKNGKPMTETEKLNKWNAVRGWVCQRLEEPDREGPDHHIIVAYLNKKIFYSKYFKIGYNTYHWACSYPEHYKWFYRTLNPGNSLTLLVNPENREDIEIFGQFETFVKRNNVLEWAAN